MNISFVSRGASPCVGLPADIGHSRKQAVRPSRLLRQLNNASHGCKVAPRPRSEPRRAPRRTRDAINEFKFNTTVGISSQMFSRSTVKNRTKRRIFIFIPTKNQKAHNKQIVLQVAGGRVSAKPLPPGLDNDPLVRTCLSPGRNPEAACWESHAGAELSTFGSRSTKKRAYLSFFPRPVGNFMPPSVFVTTPILPHTPHSPEKSNRQAHRTSPKTLPTR